MCIELTNLLFLNLRHGHHHLLPEIVDIVIDFALGYFPQTEWEYLESGGILLACALVCKTWLWPAQCRPQSLHFGREQAVSIRHTSQELLTLSEIFGSLLRTLDPRNIQRLVYLTERLKMDIWHFSRCYLSTLDIIPLPSLHTLSFINTTPRFSKGEDTTSFFASTIRSKIKAIKFWGGKGDGPAFPND